MDRAKPKLLMADDSLPMRTVVEMAFTDEGFDVWTANDGESAMLKFIEIQPDILMVDIGLPDMSGYQICEMIKQDETTRHIPVLLLVGSYEPYDAEEARRAGADGHLTKPFRSKQELVDCVKDLIQTEGPRATVGPETDDIEDLYKSSFSDTAKIEDFETVENTFAGEDFDDEMIEAFSPDARVDDHVEETSMGETSSMKEFDWSPEAVVTANGIAETATIEVEHSPSFDGGAPAVVVNDELVSPAVAESIVETSEPLAPDAPVSETIEPTPELIELVADRVIERLSDQVIREIAEQTVPQIAEKLMREALSGTKRED